MKRKLATILATDCVGFSKHMEKQEEKTLESLKACREIIDPLINKYSGILALSSLASFGPYSTW